MQSSGLSADQILAFQILQDAPLHLARQRRLAQPRHDRVRRTERRVEKLVSDERTRGTGRGAAEELLPEAESLRV